MLHSVYFRSLVDLENKRRVPLVILTCIYISFHLSIYLFIYLLLLLILINCFAYDLVPTYLQYLNII